MRDNTIERSKEIFKQKCVEHHLKITPQRMTIYEELLKAKDHPSADVIYNRVKKILSNISFDTVYRTLLSFVEIGFVNLVEGYGDKMRFEPNLNAHHHFRCMKCHAITDIHNNAYNSIEVPEELKKQFHVFRTRVVLEGVCKKCSEKK